MVEKKASNSESVLKDIVESPYKYGFKTDIETEQFPKGVNTEIIGHNESRILYNTAKHIKNYGPNPVPTSKNAI